MSRVATRFAPSPTGKLHLGHAFSALRAHDYARERGGEFLLRIEDIDPGRSRPEHVAAIIEDMLWLELHWDGEIVYQSERLGIYGLALEELKERGLAYPCFCTRADIAASGDAPHGPEGPVYPGTCRALAAPDLARPHCWRLDMAKAVAATGPLDWTDGEGNGHPADPQAHGDVVLARKDAPVSYHLAVTVDDAAQEITHVVRGQDLLASTDVHRLLQALLGLPSPAYIHHPLLATASGERLAKRTGAPTLASLREAGEDPHALVAALREGRLPPGIGVLDLSAQAPISGA